MGENESNKLKLDSGNAISSPMGPGNMSAR